MPIGDADSAMVGVVKCWRMCMYTGKGSTGDVLAEAARYSMAQCRPIYTSVYIHTEDSATDQLRGECNGRSAERASGWWWCWTIWAGSPFCESRSVGRHGPLAVTGMCACTTSAFWWRSELGKSSRRRHSPTTTPCSCCFAPFEHEDGFPGACAYSPTCPRSISLTKFSSPTCWVLSTAEATCCSHPMAHVCYRL